jgi:DNA-binding NtrC family response regulator
MLNFSSVNTNIIIVDDEQSELNAYSFLLQTMGLKRITTVKDSRDVMSIMEQYHPAIVFLDLNMPYKSGKEVLIELRETHPHTPVIICTANSDVEVAVECLKLGAHDYLVKPIDSEKFGSALRNALEISALRYEVMALKGLSISKKLQHPSIFSRIITKSPAMLRLFQYIESTAASGQPVLILGETGSGKELFARAIHDVSGYPGKFVAVDVSGLDDTLFSDTLFGHKKGAFTSAEKDRTGLIHKAASGTLFLDEIGDLSKPSQVKLLRLIQEGIYYPLGDDQPKNCQARIITATNKSLNDLTGREDEFRIDLYYRLSTHLIQIPALRERKEDIPILAAYLADQAATSMGKKIVTINKRLLDLFAALPFPGNVRELKTYVYDAVAQCQSEELNEMDIGSRLSLAQSPHMEETPTTRAPSLETLFGHFPTLSELSEYAVQKALEAANNNQSKAAMALGISKQALSNRLKRRKS